MKKAASLTLFACVVLLLADRHGPVCAQKPPEETKTAEKDILGFWTIIYGESNGDHFSSIATECQLTEGPRFNPTFYSPMLWKFSKEKIEAGPDLKDTFPSGRYRYELNPGGKKGAINLISLDKKNKDIYKQQGIYLLKDDFLMICLNGEAAVFGKEGPRPERFTSSKKPLNSVAILRRGRLEPLGKWEGRKHRLPD